MSVVVVDRDAATLPDELEPPGHACERGDGRLGLVGRHTCVCERGERCRGVAPVVLAGHRQREADGLELPTPDRVRRRVEPALEALLELDLGGVRRMMVELDVRDGRDVGLEREDRPVGLVPLDDERTRPRAGVAAQLRHDPAEDPGRIATRLARRAQAIIAAVVVLP